MDLIFADNMNRLVGALPAFDVFLHFIQNSYIVKGLFATFILVMLLTAHKVNEDNRLLKTCATLIVVFIAIFLGRVLQMVLPFSPRPLHTEGLDLTLANGLKPDVLSNDSSFPSDHALMFFAMACSVLCYQRLAGAVLLVHATVVISLPRLILGFHWMSDIAAGAILGGLLAFLLHPAITRWLSRSPLLAFRASYPGPFHALLFALLCETATMYQGSRQLLSFLADLARLA